MVEEVSLKTALQALLTDPELADLELRGSDGKIVHANRCLLASRSAVLRAMLLGKFKEATDPVVNLSYPGDVIQALVEYIYTDNVSLVNQDVTADTRALSNLVHLRSAAGYYGLGNLVALVEAKIANALKQAPALSISVLENCESHEDGAPSIERIALKAIVGHKNELLVNGDATPLARLSQVQFQKLLQVEKLKRDPLTQFLALQKWIDGLEAAVEDVPQKTTCKRTAQQMIAENVNLAGINPTDLTKTVEPSGLATNKQILDAYKWQATHAQQRGIRFANENQDDGVWMSNNSAVVHGGPNWTVETVQCEPLVHGSTTWRIQVQETRSDIEIGVTPRVLPREGSSSRLLNEGWSVDNSGVAFQKGKRLSNDRLRIFCKGMIITFVLDLTGSGTLSVGYDDAKPAVVFSNMLMQSSQNPMGFYPAAEIMAPARIRFLGFA